MTTAGGTGSRAATGAILALLVVVAFWPSLGHDFVGFDDERYLTANRHVQEGLTLSSLGWAFTSFHAANWHPLTWISHQLDWQLFGADATGHHLTSLLLHVANTLLVFFILVRATGAPVRAALVALLFGLHPQHVESVAWVAERKDVLCACFWLLALGAHVHYTRAPAVGRYLLVALLAAAALLAKPMAVSLPLTLLLLDYWPLDRLSSGNSEPPAWRAALLEKLPLLALAAASAAVTLLAQRAAGAVAPLEHLPLGARVANALVAYATYLGRTLWPAGLAVPYPHPGTELAAWKIAVSIGLLALVTWVAVRARRRHPYLLFGWLWFLATLVPVIGLVQVGPQATADRYTYLPLIGIFVMVAWGIPSAVGPLSKKSAREGKAVRRETGLLALCFLLVPVLTVATWVQLRHWRDGMSLAARAVAVTRDNAVARDQLGLAFLRRGQAAEALPHLIEATRLKPGFARAHHDLGGALAALGRIDDAIERYREALRLKPTYAEARLNLGVALIRLGRLEEAMAQFEEALRLRPDYGKAHANLAAALHTVGDHTRAWEEIERAREGGFEPPADLVRSISERLAGGGVGVPNGI